MNSTSTSIDQQRNFFLTSFNPLNLSSFSLYMLRFYFFHSLYQVELFVYFPYHKRKVNNKKCKRNSNKKARKRSNSKTKKKKKAGKKGITKYFISKNFLLYKSLYTHALSKKVASLSHISTMRKKNSCCSCCSSLTDPLPIHLFR